MIEVMIGADFEQALKTFSIRVKKSGLLRELKLRQAFEKPSQRRRRERAENIRAARRRAIGREREREFFATQKRTTQQDYARRKREESLKQSIVTEGKE
jgi:small subunit ribosomal protein S21